MKMLKDKIIEMASNIPSNQDMAGYVNKLRN